MVKHYKPQHTSKMQSNDMSSLPKSDLGELRTFRGQSIPMAQLFKYRTGSNCTTNKQQLHNETLSCIVSANIKVEWNAFYFSPVQAGSYNIWLLMKFY